MELYRGRLFDHVHLKVRDLAASRRFYEAALGVLGVPAVPVGDNSFYADELFIEQAGAPNGPVHIAFQGRDRAMVEAWHKAVLAAGGRDNGAPGLRQYHPNYYAAFAFDPDGNNVECVYHGAHDRSADSIRLTIAGMAQP